MLVYALYCDKALLGYRIVLRLGYGLRFWLGLGLGYGLGYWLRYWLGCGLWAKVCRNIMLSQYNAETNMLAILL